VKHSPVRQYRVVRNTSTPTFGLLAGLAVTLSAVAVYACFTIVQLRGLRALQADTIDRNRKDSLLLLRIQNDLNSIALAMRDMLDGSEPYPLTAWKSQFTRIQSDLADAMSRAGAPSQRRYLGSSIAQFWDALDGVFALAEEGHENAARERLRNSLQARHAALSTMVARQLIQNNESEALAALQTQAIYTRAEGSVYLFLAAMLAVVLATGLYLVHYNRRIFGQVEALSERRSELAQQLISIQENTFRYIARELHDEFGQILTAIGAMLQRAGRPAAQAADLRETREIVQGALEKVRTLSRALHPVILEEIGLEAALNEHLPLFERQMGIRIRYRSEGEAAPLDRTVSIHLYRVLQEALNNVARHSKSAQAAVRLRYLSKAVVLEVEDEGIGFGNVGQSRGMGLVGMRERAMLMNGSLELLDRDGGGALVRLTVPIVQEAAHAGA
jgi:signal transduction histidine kinase